ncbi:MAG: hypothetical protein ACTHK4_05005 [Mycobacteriales bacterium]
MSPTQLHSPDDEHVAFGEVIAELLRAPYVWWLLIAMALQAYTPIYITPVAASIVATAAAFARQSVLSRRPESAEVLPLARATEAVELPIAA